MKFTVVVCGVLLLAALALTVFRRPSTTRLALVLWIIAATVFGICLMLVLEFTYW